ncbi:MAG: LacI family DNA-binding transcriptional regulator [Acidimicrobiales bacterium]
MDRPPLRTVAALAQVSEPTVSRVLNGRTGVSDALRARVVTALSELGYHDVPEPTVQRRGVVGIVCGDLLNPVFPTMLHHISAALGRRGYLTSVAIVDEHLNSEERCLRELRANGVDGVVLIGGRHAEVGVDVETYRRLIDNDLAVVLVNGTETSLPVPHVRCDEGLGAAKAVDHLLGLGHQRVGCVLGSHRFIPSHRMQSSYRMALTEAGIEPDPNDVIVSSSFTFEEARAAAFRLIDRGVTGILAGNDLMALGVLRAGLDLGRSVPGELSVVGYDGTGITGLTKPALTTLRQPFEEMGNLIADAIRSETEGRGFRDSFVFEPHLVARESSGPFQSSARPAR